MGREIVRMKIDAVFKKFFMDNVDMLKAFLSDILEIPLGQIGAVQILNPEMPPESEEGKFSRLDLSLEVGNQLVDVEIQLRYKKDYRERTLFYWAKLYTSGLRKGGSYKELKRTIAINIVDFTLFKDRADYHTEIVAATKDTHEVFTDKFSIHFFELNKVKPELFSKPLDRKAVWMAFFNADTEEALEKVKGLGGEVMEKAVEIVYDMSEDGRLRELARWREKALWDMNSSLDEARTEGKAEATVASVRAVMTNLGKTLEEALAILGITADDYEAHVKFLED